MGNEQQYNGFEQGPIRPPSEAASLLVRVTRNCPWNRCTFCGLYEGETFSQRPVDHVLRDIDQIRLFLERLKVEHMAAIQSGLDPSEKMALHAAAQWLHNGAESIFLQDSNSLIVHPERLMTILKHLRECFPWVGRVTSYARSQTVQKIELHDLQMLAEAGLNRIHIGLESGADEVLKRIQKGSDKNTHILGGQKVKEAGIELSEYVMPGIGGREFSREHALETADALNQINPDFIRIRTLAVPDYVVLAKHERAGYFQKLNDKETADELHLFLSSLQGITSTIKSDHILNLFENIDGRLPDDHQKMLQTIEQFQNLPADEQAIYQIGRRTGIFRSMEDLTNTSLREQTERVYRQLAVTPETVDQVVDELIKRFI